MSTALLFKWFQRALWLIVSLGLIAFAALTVWLSLSAIFFPYQLDDGEGLMLEFTRLVAQGQPIYKPLFDFPYMPSNYPPVVMFLAAPFYLLFGASFMPGRILTLASVVVISFLLYQFAQRETKQRAVGAIVALLFVGSTFVYHWAPLFRVDLIGLAFSLAGIYFVWRWEIVSRLEGWKVEKLNFFFAIIFFILALYTKYTLIAAPGAACLAIFLRNRRAGIFFALALGISGGALFLIGNLMTRGGMWEDLIAANASVWSWDTFARILTLWLKTYAVVIVLGVWELVRRVRERNVGVLEIYFLATLATLLFSGRIGAWENYYFEVSAMACVFCGFRIGSWKLEGGSWKMEMGAWTLPLLLVVQLCLFIPEHDPRVAVNLMNEIDASNRALAPILAATRDPILAEDVGALVQTHHPVVYYPFLYSSLARGGKWDQSWESSNLRAGTFPLVILNRGTRVNVDNFQRFTHAFASALDANYALSETLGRYELYRPAPLDHSASFNFEDRLALVAWSSSPAVMDATTRSLTVSLLWQARTNLSTRYTTFVHLEDAQGAVLAQDDHEPRGGDFPTTTWVKGDEVREVYALRLKQALAPGKYFLRAGWYDTLTKESLSVGADDFATVEEIEIR